MVEQLPLKQLVTGSSPVEGTLQNNKNKVYYKYYKKLKNMALTTKEKTKIIKGVSENEKNTGSIDVQIALLSKEIDKLVLHLKKHPQDVHSKRGLLRMVIKRKKLLAYLKKDSEAKYTELIKKIGLKK